jgi:propanol-preferring alcohol dehydrogenase
VVATDLTPEAMKQAERNGAVTVPGGGSQVEAIRELGRGVDAAFDFVGVTPTMKVAQGSMAPGGLSLVSVAAWWSGRSSGRSAGQIRPEIERFPMDQALEAYRRLEARELSARAVAVPHG